MDMSFVECNDAKCRAMGTLDKNIAGIRVIDEELWRQKDKDDCRGGQKKALALFQDVE